MKTVKHSHFKIIALIVSFCLVGILATGLASFFSMKNIMKQSAFNTFAALRETKKQQIETYFNTIRNQCETFAQDLMVISAMNEFKKGFNSVVSELHFSPEKMKTATESLEAYYRTEYLARLNANTGGDQSVKDYFGTMQDVTKILQYLYISNNPNPVGHKDNLDTAGDDSTYSAVHAKYHPIMREYLKKFGYYDIFLIDIETGSLVYTVYKEVDFATSLLDGPFKNTNLAKIFLKAQEAQKPGFVGLIDFEFYDPSYGKPASFIASPIFDKGKKIGVLIFQMPIDKINAITTNEHKWEDTGLGKTGEVYLIGQDYKMRTDSRFLLQDPDAYLSTLNEIGINKNTINKIKLLNSTILIQEINTVASRNVIRSVTDTLIDKNYRNVPVISSFTPIDLVDFTWGLIAEIDTSEIFQPVYAHIWIFILGGFIFFCIITLLAYLFARKITMKHDTK